jgi:hypothetical protein
MRWYRRKAGVTAALGDFLRKLSPMHARLVQSVCPRCKSFVAASARPDLLAFVEQLHHCAGFSLPVQTNQV